MEPDFGLRAQADLWRDGYIAFLVLSVLCLGAVAWSRSLGPTTGIEHRVEESSAERPITCPRRSRWILLATVPPTWVLPDTSSFTTGYRPFPYLLRMQLSA